MQAFLPVDCTTSVSVRHACHESFFPSPVARRQSPVSCRTIASSKHATVTLWRRIPSSRRPSLRMRNTALAAETPPAGTTLGKPLVVCFPRRGRTLRIGAFGGPSRSCCVTGRRRTTGTQISSEESVVLQTARSLPDYRTAASA